MIREVGIFFHPGLQSKDPKDPLPKGGLASVCHNTYVLTALVGIGIGLDAVPSAREKRDILTFCLVSSMLAISCFAFATCIFSWSSSLFFFPDAKACTST